jgi:hypothetical protein
MNVVWCCDRLRCTNKSNPWNKNKNYLSLFIKKFHCNYVSVIKFITKHLFSLIGTRENYLRETIWEMLSWDIPKWSWLALYAISRIILGVYKRMVRFQKFIKRLHSATGRCSPHFHRNVRELRNRFLQQRWIGRAANGDNHIHILCGTNSTIVWMCVVWPRVHTLKDYD